MPRHETFQFAKWYIQLQALTQCRKLVCIVQFNAWSTVATSATVATASAATPASTTVSPITTVTAWWAIPAIITIFYSNVSIKELLFRLLLLLLVYLYSGCGFFMNAP